jgi:hypothetical protein
VGHLRRGGFPFFVSATRDFSSLRPHSQPFTCVLREIRPEVTRKVLLLGIAACGDTSETLDDLLSEIDVPGRRVPGQSGHRMWLNSSGGQTCPDYSGH